MRKIGIYCYLQWSRKHKKFFNKLVNIKQAFDVLIIDDNSPDNTWSIIEKYKSYNSKKINLLKRSKKEGLNTAHKLGYNYAKNNYVY